VSLPTSLLCPIDFSPSSRGALHYALAIARRYHANLIVMTVDDPLLAEVGDTRLGSGWLCATSENQLRALVAEAERGFAPVDVTYDVRVGAAAPAILNTARERGCQLIVMGAHGRSGARELWFGATAERVLRETTVAILLAPADPGPLSFEELARAANPMLVPVDFSSASAHQVQVAGWIADALHLRVLIGHVVEPVDPPVPEQIDSGEIISERHRRACQGLQLIAIGGSLPVAPEILIASGRPAEEIARWTDARHVGLLVMALHCDAYGGPRMGSVTYRAIAMSGVLTLALPPAPRS
jgi:nucleotide-binding universal stress UspA family protein